MSLIVGFTVGVISCSTSSTDDPLFRDLPFEVTLGNETEYLRVGENEVGLSEIKLVARSQVNALKGRFGHLGDPRENPQAWSAKTEGGTSPLDVLRNTTLTETVRGRVKLDLASSLSIRADTTFEAFHRRWQVENLNRKEVSQRGETLYGPVEYSFEEFYSLELRSLELAMMQRLEEKDLLKKAESLWDQSQGESRRERIERLYKKYINMQIAQTRVLLNRPAFENLDLFGPPTQ